MKSWFGTLRQVDSTSRSAQATRTFRPRLEALEDRSLPSGYLQANLASDLSGVGSKGVDPYLMNPWGLAFNTQIGYLWASDNANSRASVFKGDGTPFPPGITVNHGAGSTASNPTGCVYNNTTGFVFMRNGKGG